MSSSLSSSVLQSAPATVEMTLGTTLFVLQPKLSAMKGVNRITGEGFAGTLRGLNDLNVDVMAAVIIAGTGATAQQAKEIEEACYHADSWSLQPLLVRFVNICMVGGRDPDDPAARDQAA